MYILWVVLSVWDHYFSPICCSSPEYLTLIPPLLSPLLIPTILPSLRQKPVSLLQNPHETSRTQIGRELISRLASELSSSGLGLL